MQRKRTSRWALLAFLILLPTTVARSQDPFAADGESPETAPLDQEYQRYFIVRYDRTLLPLSGALLPASLSDDLVHRALTACGVIDLESQIDLSTRGRIGFFDQPGMRVDGRICFLGFRCSEKIAPKVRRDIWFAVVKELEQFWASSQNVAQISRQNQHRQTSNRLAEELDKSEALLDHMLDEYIELQVATVTTSDALRKELQTMIVSRREIALTMKSLAARRQAVQERIDSIRKQHASQTEKDEIGQQLAQIVSIRETALARVVTLHESGQCSTADVATAQEALALAKVELIRARENQASSGVKELESLNEALAQMGIDLVEQKVTLEETLKQVVELKDELREQLQAEKNLDRTKRRVERLQSQVRTLAKRRAELDAGGQFVQPVSITPWGE